MRPCFECGMPGRDEHHVVPKSKGGTKTVTLCSVCHGKVHDTDMVRHAELQRLGIEKAKAAGLYTGRKKGTTVCSPDQALKLQREGFKLNTIAKILGVSKPTVCVYLRSAKEAESRC